MRWYVVGAFIRPKGILLNSNCPVWVMNVVLCCESGSIVISQNTLARSKVEKNLASEIAIVSSKLSSCGTGNDSGLVYLFNFL